MQLNFSDGVYLTPIESSYMYCVMINFPYILAQLSRIDNGHVFRMDESLINTMLTNLFWHLIVMCNALLCITHSKGNLYLQKLM